MRKDFDITIIGGGIYGCVCAYFLSQQNKRVLLIEKDKVGSSGATNYSRGIVRAYDPDDALAEISKTGAMYLDNWEKHNFPGFNPYTASGFLYMLDRDQATDITKYASANSSKEYPIQILSANEVSQKFPWIKRDPKRIGIFEEKGGYGDPRMTAFNFMQGFRNQGGSVYENCEVKGFENRADGSWDIRLPIGSVSSRVVLFTTGGFTKSFFPELPIFTRSITLTQVKDSRREVGIPLIDEGVVTYLRPGEGGSFYAGSQEFEAVDHPDLLSPKSPAEYQDSMERLQGLLTRPSRNTPLNYLKGYDSYTDEKRPIVQFLKDYQGIYVATGFSGRGYKCSIAMGKLIANEINNYLGHGSFSFEKINWKLPLKALQL